MGTRFISIDGIDGCGKSTQIELLSQWLQARGHSTITVRDPGGTALGESLREILLHRQDIDLDVTAEMLVYMASRAQLVGEVIRPALADGEIVIADRYLLANVVYQGSAGGLDPKTIWQVGQVATAGISPDLTLILDLPPETAAGRLGSKPDRMESRGLDYMTKVRAGFLEEASVLGTSALILDATQPISELHGQICDAMRERLDDAP